MALFESSGIVRIAAAFVTFAMVAITGPLPAAEKYALLVGIAKYERSDSSFLPLVYPEHDARELKNLLQSSGYHVEILLREQAKLLEIRKKLREFNTRGRDQGVVLVGLFGHGIEFSETKKSYFCPYDTQFERKYDGQGRLLYNDNVVRLGAAPASLLAMDEVLIALGESNAANRVLLADCCRNEPDLARGGNRDSFGSHLNRDQLPDNTAALFACSSGQKAFEHSDWGHGAFTKVLLDVMRRRAADGKATMGSIADEVVPAVIALTGDKQKPNRLERGSVVDLMLASSDTTRTRLPPASALPLASSLPPAPLVSSQPVAQPRLNPGQVLTVRKVIGPGVLSTTFDGKEAAGKSMFFNEEDQVLVREVGPESVLIASLEGGRFGWLSIDLVAKYLVAP
jgi:hypothetical protein